VKCLICGKRALPGAKLCGPCKAAIRRSRDASVWELPNIAIDRSRAIGRASPSARDNHAPALIDKERPADTHVRPHRQPLVHHARARTARVPGWMLMLVCASIGAVTALSLSQTSLPIPTLGAASSNYPPLSPLHIDPLPALRPLSLTRLRDDLASTKSESDATAARLRDALRRSAPPPPVATPTPVEVPAPRTEPVVVATAPPAVAVAPPVKSRWQLMAETLDRCPSGLLDRVGCEQRTRLDFCEGYWGQVAQCPAGIANDHGQ